MNLSTFYGGEADHLALEAALEAYERAEGTDQDHAAWAALYERSIPCGWSFASPETLVDFSQRRARAFRKTFGVAA